MERMENYTAVVSGFLVQEKAPQKSRRLMRKTLIRVWIYRETYWSFLPVFTQNIGLVQLENIYTTILYKYYTECIICFTVLNKKTLFGWLCVPVCSVPVCFFCDSSSLRWTCPMDGVSPCIPSLSWDRILGHHFDKRLKSFAPCFSQSFYRRFFSKKTTLLWL